MNLTDLQAAGVLGMALVAVLYLDEWARRRRERRAAARRSGRRLVREVRRHG